MALSSQTAHDRAAPVFVLSTRHTLSHLEVPAGAVTFWTTSITFLVECTVYEQMLFVDYFRLLLYHKHSFPVFLDIPVKSLLCHINSPDA